MPQSPRHRRLYSDEKAIRELKAAGGIFDYSLPGPIFGGPPEVYLLTFRGNGLSRPDGSSEVVMCQRHQVLIRLGAAYPRMMPELVWKTPIFHPNISSNGIVCLGGYSTHWVPSLRLDQLCEMLWDMIRYENFDVESPYNREAAQWARTQTTYRFPVDPRPLRGQAAVPAAQLAPPVATVEADTAPRCRYPTEGFLRPAPAPWEVDEPEIRFMEDELEIVDAELVPGRSQREATPDILFIE